MGTTFMELTNKALRKINEVPLTDTSFTAPRGIHAVAKDAVLDIVSTINQEEPYWPFYAYEHTMALSPGIQEYSWPTDFVSADWISFMITNDETLGVNAKHLRVIEKEEWYERHRVNDMDAAPAGLNIPDFVWGTHGLGFGIGPSPDREYTIKFRYWKNPVVMASYSDECPLPPEFDYVIQAGVLKELYSFLDNEERAVAWEARFKDGIKTMKRNLIGDNYHYAWDGRVNRMPLGNFWR